MPRSAMPVSCGLEGPVCAAPDESLLTAPVPSRTPPVLPGSRPVPVIIGPVFPAVPPCWTPLVESGVPAAVVADGPVVTPPGLVVAPACGDAAPPACGDAEPPACGIVEPPACGVV